MELTLNITHDDICNGVADDCARCPVALATIRAFAAAGHTVDRDIWNGPTINVSGEEIDVWCDDGSHYRASQTTAITAFVDAYDAEGGYRADTYYAKPFVALVTFDHVAPAN